MSLPFNRAAQRFSQGSSAELEGVQLESQCIDPKMELRAEISAVYAVVKQDNLYFNRSKRSGKCVQRRYESLESRGRHPEYS